MDTVTPAARMDRATRPETMPSDTTPLPILPDLQTEEALLARAIRERFGRRPEDRPVRILEAGCGRSWPLDLTGVAHRLTGIDLNAASLRLRTDGIGDLDEAIVGDLRTVDLGDRTFDVVYSSFVLEHVEQADQVLDRFAEWLAPGGIVLLRVPDRDSVWGWAARRSPHRVHVWFRRHVMGMREAGRPGFGPFPVVYEPVVSLAGITAWAADHGLVVEQVVGTNHWLDRTGALRPIVRVATATIARCSAGRLAADHNNLTFVLAHAPATGAGASGSGGA